MRKSWPIILCLIVLFTSCGKTEKKHQDLVAPHTGDPVVELEEKSLDLIEEKTEIKLEKTYYVHASQLNVRSSKEIGDNLVGRLELDDEVIAIGYDVTKDDEFIEIKIVKTKREIKEADSYYVSFKYLGEERLPAPIKQEREKKLTYFAIQNIATKKVRVYMRLPGSNGHIMVFEESMVPGRDSAEDRTVLGRFQISSWHKFYEDYKKRYPSWYKEGLPEVPAIGSNYFEWKKSKYMENPKQSLRGAFGWYTAHLTPNAKGQWMHGTIGHGKDSNRFIETEGSFMQKLLGLEIGSSGCSRLNNEAITYLREILPVGTPIFKIYAKETSSDQFSTLYDGINFLNSTTTDYEKNKKFSYVLTKEANSKSGVTSLLDQDTTNENVLAFGTYKVDQTPTVVKYYPKSHQTDFLKNRANYGNTYDLQDDQLQGVFQVDKGILIDYKHPEALEVKGYTQMPIPDYISAKN